MSERNYKAFRFKIKGQRMILNSVSQDETEFGGWQHHECEYTIVGKNREEAEGITRKYFSFQFQIEKLECEEINVDQLLLQFVIHG